MNMPNIIVLIFFILNIITITYANELSPNIVSNEWNNILFIYRKYEPGRFKNEHISIEAICKTNSASNSIRTKYYIAKDSKTINVIIENEGGVILNNTGHRTIKRSDIDNHHRFHQLFFYGDSTSLIGQLEYNDLFRVKKDGIYRLRIQCHLYEDDGGKELKEVALPEVIITTKIYTGQ